MPSPVGHALGGLIVAGALGWRQTRGTDPYPAGPSGPSGGASLVDHHRPLALLCVVAACLPDIDFGWGRHNMETHSLGFALLLGLLALAWKRSPQAALAVTLAAGTHVLFDWLGSDDFPPLGVMALWPWSHEFYFAEAYVFATISRRYWLPGFVQHNLLAVLREIAILLPLVAAVYWWRWRSLGSGTPRNIFR